MFLMHASAAVLLAAGCSFWLAGAGYSTKQAVLLAVMTLGEAGPLLTAVIGQSLWLAVGVLAVAMSAEAFARQADVRRIVLLGGSLAAIQLLDPLGIVVAAGLLPATLALERNRGGPRRALGLYVLLMFMPLTMAALLLYSARLLYFDPIGLFAGFALPDVSPAFAIHTDLVWRLAPVAAFALIVTPALPMPMRLRKRYPDTIALVAFGVAVAGAAGAILGVAREPLPLLAAAAPIAIGAFVQQPESPQRNRNAFIVAMLCLALSWIAAFALFPQVYA